MSGSSVPQQLGICGSPPGGPSCVSGGASAGTCAGTCGLSLAGERALGGAGYDDGEKHGERGGGYRREPQVSASCRLRY